MLESARVIALGQAWNPTAGVSPSTDDELSPADEQLLQAALAQLGLLPAVAQGPHASPMQPPMRPPPQPPPPQQPQQQQQSQGAPSQEEVQAMVQTLASAMQSLAAQAKLQSQPQAYANASLSPSTGSPLQTGLGPEPAVEAQARSSATTSTSGFYPIGSGDNLNQFRLRVQAVKEWYSEVRTYLHIDDAVRIGGYIDTLAGLEIAFIQAFPIAELIYYLALVSLGSAVINSVGASLRVVGYGLLVPGSIISLEIVVVNAQRAGLSGSSSQQRAAQSTDTTGVGLDPTTLASYSRFANDQQMAVQLMTASEQVPTQDISWALSGSAGAPLELANRILAAASDSLQRINDFVPPSAAG